MKHKSLPPRHYYSPEELASFWKSDLLNDAKHAREQAANGPFYPHLDITKESLLAYAAQCDREAGLPIPAQFARSVVMPPR